MKRPRSTLGRWLATGGWVGLCTYAACSNAGSPPPPAGAGGTSPPVTSAGGSTAGLGGATAVCGNGGAGGGGGTGGALGSSTFPNVGVCFVSGTATADATSYDGQEVRYLKNDNGLGDTICQVQFDLKRVGDAPPCCPGCAWAHLLEYGNPKVLTDTEGACAQSDLALDAAGIAKIVGSRVGMAFAEHFYGSHQSARLVYYPNTKTWDVAGKGNWSQDTKSFAYDNSAGFCNYGP